MALRLAPSLRQYGIWDRLPDSGGLIYTYAAGTSTPIDTFKDSNGTVWTNPIVRDSDGGFQLWLTEGVGYKFVVKSAAGDLIDTIDNVVVSAGTSVGGETVKVSSDDTTAGYLEGKVQVTGLTMSTSSPGANEKLTISAAKIPAVVGDSAMAYLSDKIVAGTGVTKSTQVDPSFGTQVKISMDASGLEHNDLAGRTDSACHPIYAIDATQGTLGTPTAPCPGVFTNYLGSDNSHGMATSDGIQLIISGASMMGLTEEGGLATMFIAQEAISKGSLLSVSPINGQKLVLTPSYGLGTIGVAWRDAAAGQTVWAVIKGKVKINMISGSTVAPGDFLSPASTPGAAQRSSSVISDVPGAYSSIYERAVSRIGMALGPVDAFGRIDAII